MSEEVKNTSTGTAVAPEAPEATQPPAAAEQKKPAGKKRKKGHLTRNLIIAAAVVAALGVGAYFLFSFLGQHRETNSQIMTQIADFGSIQSSVQGSGPARSKESAAITLEQAGTVQKLYVTEGDAVTAGQPLYTIFSQAAEDEVSTRQNDLQRAQNALADLQREMSDLYRQQNNLTVRAPFDGKVTEVGEFTEGLDIGKGSTVCTLVNDRRLKLSLFFSYAYESAVHVGQSASVSLPALMQSLTGYVETIHKVHYISPEGTDNFEVILVFDNPGTLTEKMAATASLTAADGSAILPYKNGETEYYETRRVVTEAGGPMVANHLLRYADVKAGDALLVMSSDTIDEELRSYRDRIETAQKSVTDAQDALAKAQEALQNFNAVAPIDGTVSACSLVEGQEVKSGDTVITITNNTTMVVTINVDDRNIAYVKPGMMVDLQSERGDGNTYRGTVTKIDMSLSGDAMGSGMTRYPVTLEVDNMDGSLLDGMWLNYSFITSQSDGCIVVPMQSVKYMSLEDGDTASVVFIQADSRPENAVDVDIPEPMPGETPSYPSQSDGYYPVVVETGLSDNYNVEIKSGLEGGEEVFVSYIMTQAWGG